MLDHVVPEKEARLRKMYQHNVLDCSAGKSLSLQMMYYYGLVRVYFFVLNSLVLKREARLYR